MTRKAPALASLLLERLGPEDEVLLGDLQEEYAAGRSAFWYWRQVCTAVAMATWSDLRVHPLIAARAVIVGLLALIVFNGVAIALFSSEMAGRAHDWMIVKYGSRDLPMLWVTRHEFWLVMWTSHVFSGFAIARLHRRAVVGALTAFTIAVMLKTSGEAIDRSLSDTYPYWTPFSPTMFWMATALAPLLIVAGGCLGVRRRSRTDTSTT